MVITNDDNLNYSSVLVFTGEFARESTKEFESKCAELSLVLNYFSSP